MINTIKENIYTFWLYIDINMKYFAKNNWIHRNRSQCDISNSDAVLTVAQEMVSLWPTNNLINTGKMWIMDWNQALFVNSTEASWLTWTWASYQLVYIATLLTLQLCLHVTSRWYHSINYIWQLINDLD